MKIKSSLAVLALLCVMVFTGCKKDDVEKAVILQSVEYQIYDVSGSGISGTATFTQEDNGTTHVLIELDGANTSTNPAYIRFNSAAEGGDIAITLAVCECAISNTTITQLNNGNSITYEGLIALNGHITIHDANNNIVAVADIGANSN
ncbi:hypothetical protein HZY62_12215 [Maribacter polysiphoniae]|uniref:Lipoprotein n=1 Tax=Maribacter polysiphoniae TaxID=429344 RepID=A0A316E135_9FLAO|nr:hypothetical protein [Maribacter polysiphoniae]MBD1261360.1 hypothetical protein [Maribacter polysiphoniae]PWK23398.1 hypothetical protein LX92_01963 [Maribacter polysiphoniae]